MRILLSAIPFDNGKSGISVLETMTAAPAFTASGMNFLPSDFAPQIAQNMHPGTTFLESLIGFREGDFSSSSSVIPVLPFPNGFRGRLSGRRFRRG